MSTKIFNAFIWKGRGNRSLASLFALSSKIRDTLRPAAEERFFKHAGFRLAEMIDNSLVRLHPDLEAKMKAFPLLQLANEEAEAGRKILLGEIAPGWHHNAEWTFFLVRGKILLRFFGERAATDDFKRHFPQFVDYHFQTCADRPKEIPETEWKQRARDWHKIMPTGRSASESGLTMSLWGAVSGPTVFNYERVVAAQPPFPFRVRRVAYEIELNAFVAGKLKEEVNPAKATGVLLAWPTFMDSPEGRKALAARMNEVRKILPRRIHHSTATQQFPLRPKKWYGPRFLT